MGKVSEGGLVMHRGSDMPRRVSLNLAGRHEFGDAVRVAVRDIAKAI
jgi:hypothetical protein